MKNWTKVIFASLILVLAFVAAEIAKSPSADSNPNAVQIFFFNVGQGDSELIQKGDYQILIDGGPDGSVLPELGKAMPIHDHKIETIILTHPDSDHLSGINLVLDRYDIGKIYSTGVLDATQGYAKFQNQIKAKNLDFFVPEIGDQIIPFSGADLTFLWSGRKFENQTSKNTNDTSEVVKFCYSSSCALFPGDIQIDEQGTMFDYYQQKNDLNIFLADILKIPHHGSVNGTNDRLLATVSPKFAVIEVGANNSYGHPHAAILDLLQKAGIQVFRTDQDGTIKFKFGSTGLEKE